VGSLIFILAPTLGAMCLATGFVVALGIAAARADEHFDRQLAEEGGEARSSGGGEYGDPPISLPALASGRIAASGRSSYAGLARGHATMASKPRP
jgi:hypothetical protein